MEVDTQVLYLGRWVSKEHFCVFIYNNTGNRLVKSYKEFSDAISSGVWFAEKEGIKEIKDDMYLSQNDEDEKVVPIKAKRGRKCQSQQQQ